MIEYPNAIEYRFEETMSVDIQNNLTNRAITSRNDGSGNVSNNLTFADATWFIDPSIGNLRLAQAHDLVIDQGQDLLEITNDLDQNLRPAGQGNDLGAHELSTEAAIDNRWFQC